jgi:non-heme chloroperoxidase
MLSIRVCRAGLIVFSVVIALAQESGTWRDASTHRVQFITVDKDVRLEVLDWGGKGSPIVLLAGYNTAHIYDDIAPKLAKSNHVYGITRRGYGASDRPQSGYTAERSADDVLAVLESLKLSGVVLAGHSFGGQDLTTLGARHSDRLAGLVYLNSAEDATLGPRIWPLIGVDISRQEDVRKKAPPSMFAPPAPPDNGSFAAYRQSQKRAHEVAFPESELRQLFAANPDGSVGKPLTPKSIRDAIFAGVKKPEYSRIRVPVLALFAGPPSLEDMAQRYKPQDAEQRGAMEEIYDVKARVGKKHRRDLQDGVPAARVVEIAEANYYIFLSNEQDVLQEIQAFVAELR